MLKRFNYKSAQKGSMMVEALAMLGLITMVTPVLYKKAAERTTELQDINAAAQMRTLSKALDDYIKDNYVDFTMSGSPDIQEVLPEDIEPYLPYGFNLDESKLFSAFKMAYKKSVVDEGTPQEHASITGLVLAPIKNDLSIVRSSKIASMIGANGAIVEDNVANGVQGGWAAALGDYDLGTAPNGSIASSSIHAVNASSGAGTEHVLFRDDSMGDVEYNTMQVNLYMGGNSIGEVHRLIADSDSGEVLITGADEGETQKEANLVVEGAATISNLLTAGSANIADSLLLVNDTDKIKAAGKVTVTEGGIDVTGDSSITGKTTITGDTEIKKGDDGSGKLTVEGGAEISSGVNVKGGTISGASGFSGDTNNYSLVVGQSNSSDGSLLVENNAYIKNDLSIGGDFDAENIYARGILGGGRMADGTYNFLADNSSVDIAVNNMQVGDRLSISDTEAKLYVGSAVVGTDASGAFVKLDDANGVKVTDSTLDALSSGVLTAQGGGDLGGKVELDSGGAEITGTEIGLSANGGKQTVDLKSNQIAIRNTGAENPNSIYVNQDSLLLEHSYGAGGGSTASLEMTTGNIEMDATLIKAVSDNIVIDEDKMLFANDARNKSVTDSTGAFTNTVLDDGVLIRREGMISLPAGGTSDRSDLEADKGEQDVPGYIKADRLLANQAYEFPGPDANEREAGATKPYDAYQVNPAYTSVMHDIKLTTRGGARLSDILPDFINKGIYVIDNTYEEPTSGSRSWEDYTVRQSGNSIVVENQPSDCNGDMDCITTPWLGFVPTPQCPPGYSKVITINPIRWKMAEAYYVAMPPTGIPETEVAQRFKSYFVAPRDPASGRLIIAEADGSSGVHTHEFEQGMPMTFQTNTWLNTTISGVRDNSTSSTSGNMGTIRNSDFLGWHAIMGFLYHGSDYQDYLTDVAGSATANSLRGKIVWNLFPVYNEEMTAISNVYCYFERRVMSNPDWSWKSDLVDTGYDQIANFRSGYAKTGRSTGGAGYNSGDSSYRDRLNDPALGYDDPW